MAAAWLLVHAVFGGLAAYAEVHRDAYLWQEQDYLRVLSPTYHEGRGAGRLLIYGPSEARALHPESMDLGAVALSAYQNSQVWAVLEDGLIVLDYLESAYGRGGLPDAVVLGLTPRFVGNVRRAPSPLVDGINKYSPHFSVDESQHPPRLVPRSRVQGALAQLRLLSLQPDRYRRGLIALADPITRWVRPDLADRLRFATRPIRYYGTQLMPLEEVRSTLRGRDWREARSWDVAADTGRSHDQLVQFRQFLADRGIALYVVNLPEHSWNRELYDPAWYSAYLAHVQRALPGVPFLDLRAFLDNDEFYDEAHATWSGGERLSEKVAAWLCELRSPAGGNE